MASTPVEALVGISGLTLTLKLYQRGVDTIANGAGGDAMTEQANRVGCYRATVDENLNGLFEAYIFSGTDLIFVGAAWLQDDTSLYTIGDLVEATSVGLVEYTISNVTITPPASILLTTGYCLCLGTDGLPEVGALVYARMTHGPGTAGYALDTGLITMVADGNGIAQHGGFVRGARYKFMRGTDQWSSRSYTAPDADTWELAEILGGP